MVELSPLRQLRMGQLPKMVSWYDPRLLARIGVRTIISSVFGQYADQRLIQAVTDSVRRQGPVHPLRLQRPERDRPEPAHRRRRERRRSGSTTSPTSGDGFESTYTIAYLLAQDSLDVRQAGRLRHGEVLIMGGDQCYPQATREEYKKRLLTPYNWAFTVQGPGPQAVRASRQPRLVRRPQLLRQPVLLVARQALQLQGQRDRRLAVPAAPQLLGASACRTTGGSGAPTSSSRSTSTPARSTYFETVAAQMGPQDNLIICLAEPSWLLADLHGRGRGGELLQDHARSRASAACASRAVIAGDWHHYNRYFAHELDVHFITSGGGGAFLHPTHVLKNAISVRWPERPDDEESRRPARTGVRPGEAWKPKQYDIRLKRNTKAADDVVEQAVQDVQDALEPLQARPRSRPSASASRSSRRRPSAIPSKSKSYLLSLGNVLFPFYNPGFAIGLGLIYWLITWQFQTLVTRHEHLVGQDRQARHRHVALARCWPSCRSISSRR